MDLGKEMFSEEKEVDTVSVSSGNFFFVYKN